MASARKPVKEELPNIRKELELIFEDPQPWLDTPNSWFGGRKPGDLIGTPDEKHLRNWIGMVKHGLYA